MEDPRKKLIINISKCLLKETITEIDFNDQNIENTALEKFLNLDHCMTLYGTLDKSSNILKFINTIQVDNDNEGSIISFHKAKNTTITEENIRDMISINYFKGKPAFALYTVLQNIFTPMIFQNKHTIEPSVQEQILQLQNTLRASFFNNAEKSENFDESAVGLDVVLKIEHEVEYWDNISKHGKRSRERDMGHTFRDILQKLADDFGNIDSLHFLDVEDVLENTQTIFDDLWRHERYTYPQPRMQHLLSLIASQIVQYIEKQFTDIDVWQNTNQSETFTLLENSLALTKRWIEICTSLTKLFWPNHALHPWIGEPFVPSTIIRFQDRLEEMLHIKTTHRQLLKLLSQNEKEDLEPNELFKPFKNIYPLQYNSYTEPEWRTAVLKFERALHPIEERVGAKLKHQLSSNHSNIRQLLHDYLRYGELISRPTVKQILLNEREQLLASLGDYLQEITMSQQNSGNNVTMNDTPQIVQDISHLRQLESRVKEVKKVSEQILTDLKNFDAFISTVNGLLYNLKQQHSDMFDSWIRQTTKNIENQTLMLKENEPVVEFSKTKLMRVNYSSKLVVLIREVRQLSALNYRIPNHIQEVADRAKKFMSYAKILEQVANFHNTVGDRMIASQRPMMLAGAMNLAKLVQDESTVTWSDEENVKLYINKLHTAVDRLSRENNELAAYHGQLGQKVSELLETDLIRYQHKWKDGVNFMREIMDNLASKGFTNMQAWKHHWNQELAKALEYQYQLGLDQIHHHLPEIKADLIMRSGKVQFNPPIEELRMKYYNQLRRYLSIPLYFRGVSDEGSKSVFTDIIDRSSDKFTMVYVKAEELMDELNELTKKWSPWLSLGSVDLDELAETHLKTWNDWDANFRESKSFGQQIAKLSSWEEHVGYFTISLGLARSDMEAHNRRYWSTLVSSLQASIIRDVSVIERFIVTATGNLTKQPRTPDDIAEVHAAHAEVMVQTPEMTKMYNDLLHRNKILANWSKDRVESVIRLQGPWEHLQSLLSNHKQLIEKQLEGIKGSIAGAGKSLSDEVDRWYIRWEEIKPKPHSQNISELLKGLKMIKEQRNIWDGFLQQKEKLETNCSRFGVDQPDFIAFKQMQEELDSEEKKWSIVEDFNNELQKIQDEDWIVFRKQLYKLNDFITQWEEKLLHLTQNPLSLCLLQEIQKYKNALPTLKLLKGEDFTERHWTEVFNLLNIQTRPIDLVTVSHFLNVANLLSEPNVVGYLQNLNKKAASEIVVRQALGELESWEVQARFILVSHVDSNGKEIMLIKDFKEVANTIGDNQCLLQSVKTSTDYESFSERGSLWETRLADLDYFINMLGLVQHKWIYLEPIFSRGTLRQEQARFQRIDREFRSIFNSINQDSRVAALLRIPDLKKILNMLLDQLNRCQASLNNYLIEKRSKFPRFLFLSDDDLLEILGQSTHEDIIQLHLKKIFAGIHSVEIKEGLDVQDKRIVAMKSLNGEIVPLKNSINIMKPVEDWLQELVNEMQSTLKSLINECLFETKDNSNTSGADPLKYPSQILCLSANVHFTKRVEEAIVTNSLRTLFNDLKQQSKYYANLDLNTTENESEFNILELKLKALLMDLTHHLAIVEELIENNVTKLQNWFWFKQLRFYEDKKSVIKVCMGVAEFEYSFEYLGNAGKLVQTPLTDKCFLTLTQGMCIGLGGNPYGPAGTGKTESVKDLGGLLGRQVLVFNCDEGIDAKSMERILVGLARCGAWGCFDEFNRLDEGTLSSVSTQIQNIQTAIVNKATTITVQDSEVEINPYCAIFVTLNPAGAGYGARNKLPNNLKQLFRPVVMTVPDQIQIARVLLFVDGYQHSDVLSKKICELFQLSCDILPKKQHYDWGLRALKTVLKTCGDIRQRTKAKTKDSNASSTLLDEMACIVEAIKLNVLSKLSSTDRIKFEILIEDVFPLEHHNNDAYNELKLQLIQSFQQLKLQVNDEQITKCIELYEQLKQRMGVVILGPPSSGKSVIRKALLHALTSMKKTVKEYVVNPKAMSRYQLLGKVDTETRQWTGGVLTSYALQACNEPLDVWSWMVCDGDIDPEWIEALNSVLDDNRLLTLPSGWRIQFQPNVNFIFETHDLSHASPATVSRMGIISLSEDSVDIKSLIQSYILRWSEEQKLNLAQFMDDYLYKAIDWIIDEGVLALKCSKIGIILNGLTQICNATTKAQFVVGLISGLGSLLTYESRESFVKMILELTNEFVSSATPYLYYDERRDCIENYSYTDSTIDMPNTLQLPLILTNNVQHALHTINEWISDTHQIQHFLLVGPHGSAKNLILKQLIANRNDREMITIYCSENLRPEYVVQKISQYCITVSSNRGGRIFRPKKGKLILHFKGLDCLRCDSWGTNILISFLHQLINYNGVFDKNLEWIGLENILIVGTLNRATTLSARFTSIVRIYVVELPDTEKLKIIYQLYVNEILSKHLTENSSVSIKYENLATMIVEFYDEIQKKIVEINQPHYAFSPHDLTNWCYNLFRYKNLLNESFDESFMEAVCYEAKRIFIDKLANEPERIKIEGMLKKYLSQVWPNDTTIVSRIETVCFISDDNSNRNEIPLWGTLLTKFNLHDWKLNVEKYVERYENENGHCINLPLFHELLQLISKINRIVTKPGGSIILAGRTGVGRKTAVKIAAYMQGARCIFISDNVQQFKIDMKSAMQTAGIEREPTFLLLEEHILKCSFVKSILNTLISTGEAIDLYSTTELETIVSGLREQLEQDGFEGSLTEYFHHRVNEQLHIIVTLDVTNEDFIKVYDEYPELLSKCSTIWIDSWSLTTMQDMPHLIISMKRQENIDYTMMEAPSGFEIIHLNAPSDIQTPGRFITFINTYLKILYKKKKMILEKGDKLKAGVSKLVDAKQLVESLKIEAQEREKELAERQAKANEALEKITTTMKNAHSHKDELQSLKEKREDENKSIMQRKKAIELELAEVEPLIQEARAAVGNIRSESLYEIRSLRAPPDVIRDILEGVLRLMGILDTSWNSMKTFLAKRGVKEEIRSFDASFISSENRQAVEKLLNARKESFEPKNAKRASVAAAPLAAWVNANVKYARVLEKIRPLEKEQQQLQRNLQAAEEQIVNLSSDLTDVDATVAKLKVQLNNYSREAAETEVKLKAATETLTSSQGLVSKLDDEFNRWQEQLADISKEINIIPIKTLLAAAFVIYLSNETESQRKQYLQNWQKEFQFNQAFSIEEFLSTEKEQLQWQSENLPLDKLSVQNAIIMQETWLYSLLIDPSSVAVEWLKNHFRSKSVEITNQENPRFLSTLELSIRFGKILIIEEVNSIHPVLYSILRKNFVQQGSRKLIALSGRLIDFHNDFKLFFASRNPSLSITSAISSFLSIINFTTTLSGLSGQLIVSTLQQERPDLETNRRELSQKKETLQIKLEVLQDNLLEDLANAHGDILENKELLMSLNETKLNSAEVTRALKESANLHQQLSNECDVYKPLADFGSNLYFAILEINRFNPLYQLSVSTYKKLFLKILQSLQVDEMSNIDKNRRFLQLVYQYVARGLFKDDRLLFALHLAHKMIPQEIPDDEWELFTRQETAIGKLNVAHAKDHVPNWLPDNRVQEVFLLQVALPNLYSSLRLEDSASWSKFMQHTDCENNIPSDLSHKLTMFQQLLVVQALRPDRIFSAVSKCATKLIGLRNLNQSIINLSQICNEATETEPILLISSGGIDPSLEIRELAEKNMPNKFIEISMSNGETSSAILALSKASSEGYWLCLKNLHLVIEWLPILCQKIKEITTFHSNFRLWLTTESHPNFSPVLSQSSIHIAYEAPQGVKQNLLRIYDQWLNNPKIIVQKEQSQQQLQNRILFSLACIHAIVQERRNFIPQGWSTYYEFNNGDLSTAQQLILHILKHSGINIEWPVIRGLTSTAVYGGKIDSQQDDRVLQTYMQQYLNENILSHLWKPLDLSGVPHGNIQEYITFIGKLSDVDIPSYFGLPDNIHRIWEINAGATIVSQLKILALSNLISNKFNISICQSKLSPLLNLWKKLNQNHDWIHTKITNVKLIDNAVKPFDYYVQNEYTFSLNLMQFIHKCLIDISKVLRNVILPSNDLLNIGNCLINGKVPDSWLKEWEGPLEPFAYIRAVIKRVDHIIKWKDDIEKLDIFNTPIDLANLFHPETFLATLKEYTAKKKQITTENLRLSCDWSEAKTNALSVTIQNLQLEGGTFNRNILSFCKPDSPSVCTAINCQIEWILENEDFSSGNLLLIPLYYSITRQRHLANLYIPVNDSINTWIQTGVAFHLQ